MILPTSRTPPATSLKLQLPEASSFNFNVSTAGSEAEADPNGFAKEIFQLNSKNAGPQNHSVEMDENGFVDSKIITTLNAWYLGSKKSKTQTTTLFQFHYYLMVSWYVDGHNPALLQQWDK